MNEQLPNLYKLQLVDVKIHNIDQQLISLKETQTWQEKMDKADKVKAAIGKELAARKLSLRDSELELKTIDDKRASCEKRLYGGSIHNPKELAAIEKEIQSLKSKQSDLDAKVLALYDSVAEIEKKCAEIDEVHGKIAKKLSHVAKIELVESEKLKAQRMGLSAERLEASKHVTDIPLMTRYDSITKRVGAGAIAEVFDGRCMGCHIKLNSNVIQEIRESRSLVMCENCNRILYVDSE